MSYWSDQKYGTGANGLRASRVQEVAGRGHALLGGVGAVLDAHRRRRTAGCASGRRHPRRTRPGRPRSTRRRPGRRPGSGRCRQPLGVGHASRRPPAPRRPRPVRRRRAAPAVGHLGHRDPGAQVDAVLQVGRRQHPADLARRPRGASGTGAGSSRVTSQPRPRATAAASAPRNPAPTTTRRRPGPSRSRRARASSRVRSTCAPGRRAGAGDAPRWPRSARRTDTCVAVGEQHRARVERRGRSRRRRVADPGRARRGRPARAAPAGRAPTPPASICLDNGGRSYGACGSSPTRVSGPRSPRRRSVSAAASPAAEAPTTTIAVSLPSTSRIAAAGQIATASRTAVEEFVGRASRPAATTMPSSSRWSKTSGAASTHWPDATHLGSSSFDTHGLIPSGFVVLRSGAGRSPGDGQCVDAVDDAVVLERDLLRSARPRRRVGMRR